MKIKLILPLLFAALALPVASTFAADEKKPAEKSDAAVKPYPLDVCIVTDNDLGSMGEPYRIVHQGQ